MIKSTLNIHLSYFIAQHVLDAFKHVSMGAISGNDSAFCPLDGKKIA